MVNWHLSKQGVCWPVSHGHIAGSSLAFIEVTWFFFLSRPLTKYWVSIGSWADVRLTFNQGLVVCWPFNADSGLKVNRSIFLLYKGCSLLLFCVVWDYSNSKQKAKQIIIIQKTSTQSYNTQIKILAYPGLASSGFEQPGPGALLLGLAKSLY